MSLEKLSDDDLLAISEGRIADVSDAGLRFVASGYTGPTKFKEKKKKQKPEFSPTEGIPAGQLALEGLGKTFVDYGRGVGRLAGVVSGEDVAESRRLDAPLMESTPGFLGSMAGHALTGAAASFAPGANTVLGSTLYGGLYGGLQPWETADEAVQNLLLGGGVSGAITAGMRAAPLAKRAFVDPFRESGRERIVESTLQRFAANPGAPRQQSVIPGVQRTLAEATQDPGIAQLERAAIVADPKTAGEFAARDMANNAARVGALDQMSGGANGIGWMEGVRDMMAGPLYKQAIDAGVDQQMARNPVVKKQIQDLLSRPSIQSARKMAEEIAKEEGETIGRLGSVKGLHYLKRGIDRLLGGGGDRPLDAEMKRAITRTKQDLLAVIENLSPMYEKARGEFQFWSRPVNQMRVAAELKDRLVPALFDDSQSSLFRLKPGSFGEAVRNAERTVGKATGFEQPLEKLMTPQQMQIIEGLQDDLARRAFAAEAGKVPGSPTAQYLSGQNVLRQTMGTLGLSESWADSVAAQVLGSRWMSAAAKPLENKLQTALAARLLQQTGPYMRSPVGSFMDMLTDEVGRRAVPAAALTGSGYVSQ